MRVVCSAQDAEGPIRQLLIRNGQLVIEAVEVIEGSPIIWMARQTVVDEVCSLMSEVIGPDVELLEELPTGMEIEIILYDIPEDGSRCLVTYSDEALEPESRRRVVFIVRNHSRTSFIWKKRLP